MGKRGYPSGFIVSNGGTETILSGNTSVVVTHGLGYTPTLLSVEPLDEYGIGYYLTSVGVTTFTINIQVPQPSDANFKWGGAV